MLALVITNLVINSVLLIVVAGVGVWVVVKTSQVRKQSRQRRESVSTLVGGIATLAAAAQKRKSDEEPSNVSNIKPASA